MNKKKIALLAALPVLGIALVGAQSASAHGGWFSPGGDKTPEEIQERHAEMVQKKADILGISVEQLEAAREEGTKLPELIEELGLDKEELKEKMHAAHSEHMQERLQSLVDEGKITEEQAQERLEMMQERFENGDFHKKRGQHREHHRGQRNAGGSF